LAEGQTFRKVGAQSFRSKSLIKGISQRGCQANLKSPLFLSKTGFFNEQGIYWRIVMKKNGAQKKVFITAVLSGLLIFGAWDLLYYDKRINLRELFLSKIIKNGEDTKNVKCDVIQNMGKNGLLSMKMVIPCEDEEQLADLNKKMHIIKSDFLTNLDQKKVEQWVRNGKFGVIKTELLKIVNHYTDKPVENLYFESFISK
jgi:hypothetical protein